jgi:DNA modification methylase
VHDANQKIIGHLQIERRPIGALKLNPKNPRRHNRRQIRQIAKSIKKFGFNVPILVDSDLNIIAGHGRVLAAKVAGLTEVSTICLDHLTEAEIRAFVIADNRLAEISTWDDRLLAEQLKLLSQLDLDFSLEITGFDMGEIDFRIENTAKTQSDDETDSEALPPVGPAVSQPGDLWELGRHRVFCGSALESDSFAALMANQQATMVFIDPPYNVPIHGHVSGLGAVHHREFAMGCGEMETGEFTTFLGQSFALLARNSIDGSLHFCCMDWRHCGEVITAGNGVYSEIKNLCVWVKPNAGMGSNYRSRHELIFVFKNGHAAHRNNIELGKNGRHRSNVWEYPNANAFGRTSEEGPLFTLHPTVKPVRLIADAILDCTSRGDLVLDSYLGSGTTVIAAERTSRRCYGMEIDPIYIDTIVRRWQAYTGETAYHGRTKAPFNSCQESNDHAN